MKVIYIASPYRGDTEKNTKFAKKAMLYAIEHNTVPIAPHLLYPHVLDDTNEGERNMGIQLGLELLLKCDELWVFAPNRSEVVAGVPHQQLPYISEGMKAEIDIATEFRIPIKYIKELE